MNDYRARSLIVHEQLRGKIGISGKLPVTSKDDLSIAYTPGVAEPCLAIAADPSKASSLTIKNNTVAVVTDGSAVLGLGNIGPLASIPVMEGKCLLFKHYAGINAFPICLDTQDTDEIVETVRKIAPVFGGINLEDIAAPKCFEVEARLQDLGIPVFHDDQHGTAIVLLAAVINSCKVLGKELTDLKVVINGAGSAGTAIAKLLRCIGYDPSVCSSVADIVVCDSKGAIHKGRTDLNEEKQKLLSYTNTHDRSGSLAEVLTGADVFIGVSTGGLLGAEEIQTMARDAAVFAMANPEPEIYPDEAIRGGAAIVGTGRSDMPNQVNNVLAFPGIFLGALNAGATQITSEMKVAAAYALANSIEPTREKVIPSALNKSVAHLVAKAVCQCVENSPCDLTDNGH